jgi:iron(III) transport system ATP-binding protein
MPDITVAGLSKTFGQGQAQGQAQGRALSDISFSVRDKEFLTLLGPSGCGKTTTLMSIAGFQRPDQGTICCGDRIFFDRAARSTWRPRTGTWGWSSSRTRSGHT